MILVTGCNAPYRPRIHGYLHSLEQYADFPITHVGVGFLPELEFSKVTPAAITREQNEGAPMETECIQHGSFLPVIDCPANEVIMYTDGDFTMQRGLHDDERELLALPHNAVAVGYNGGEHERLVHEYTRLSPKVSPQQMELLWGQDWHARPIYNVGCVAMTRQTWETLYSNYMSSWGVISECFRHQARQQWLMSWLISEYFTEVILPWSFHAHGHFGLKPGMEVKADGVYADGRLALFRHYI